MRDENNKITAHQSETSKPYQTKDQQHTVLVKDHIQGMLASKHGRQERPPHVAIPAMSRVLVGDTLFAIAGFVTPNISDQYPLCIFDIKPMMTVFAQMASVSHAWNRFVLHNTGGFDKILHRLQTHSPTAVMDGGYRLYKFVANRIDAFPNHSREFLQILGTLSASANELRDYITICQAECDNPADLMALASGDDVKSNCDRSISLHLIGSHAVGEDYSVSGFCNDVTRRLQQRDHSAFDPNVIPSNIVRQRIAGYLALYREAQDLGLRRVPLLSNNFFQWNRTLGKALTPAGREAILHVLLQDHCTSSREAGLVG